MQWGVPVITTSIGAEGIPRAQTCMEIHDDAQSFANAIVQLYNDPKASEALRISARGILEQHFSEQAVMEVIKHDFTPLS